MRVVARSPNPPPVDYARDDFDWLEAAKKAKTKADRVGVIRTLMIRNEWLMKKWQRQQLADVWDVEVATIRDYAADAHNQLSLGPEELEQMRMALAIRMDEIAERASKTISTVNGMPDFRAWIEATRLKGEYLGVRTDEAPAKDAESPKVEIKLLTEDEP